MHRLCLCLDLLQYLPGYFQQELLRFVDRHKRHMAATIRIMFETTKQKQKQAPASHYQNSVFVLSRNTVWLIHKMAMRIFLSKNRLVEVM